jgi:DNA polymerase-3 subunit beta
MKISITQDRILSALQSIIGVVPTKSTFPVLANVLLEASKDRIKLSATDLEVAIVTETEAKVVNPGAITIPARQFFEIIKQLPSMPLEIEVNENKITIKCEKSRFNLVGIPKEEFPKIPEIKKDKQVKLSSSLLQSAIKKTLFAVANDTSRPALCGVLFQTNGDKLRVVTTDGRRLALMESLITPVSQKSELLLPPKGLNLVNKMLGSEEQEIILKFDENYSQFIIGHTHLFARHIEGVYPDYDKFIPWSNNKIVTVNTELFAAGVRRVSVFSDTFTSMIKLNVKTDGVDLSSRTADIGEAWESMPAKYNGDEMEIGYNANYLLDIIKNVEAEELNLYLSAPLSAALVRPSEEKNETKLVYLIMPIRLPE